MISYELAKKLKDAGFPQKGNGIFSTTEDFKITSEVIEPGGIHEVLNESIVYLPTLSELIEWCLNKLDPIGDTPIKIITGKAGAIVTTEYMETKKRMIRGSTPEEAVAHLGIALHMK